MWNIYAGRFSALIAERCVVRKQNFMCITASERRDIRESTAFHHAIPWKRRRDIDPGRRFVMITRLLSVDSFLLSERTQQDWVNTNMQRMHKLT